jgi:hypothetical protein
MSKRFGILRLGFGAAAGLGASLAMVMGLSRCQVPGGPTMEAPDAVAMTGGLCIGACQPDPGWGPVDCTPEQQLDRWGLETFDQTTNSDGKFVAQDWYTYTDGTAVLNFTDYFGNLVDGGFQPQVERAPLCAPDGGLGGNKILHVFAGQFLGWGGGMGLAMAKVNGREPSSPSQGTPDPLAPRGVCTNNPNPDASAPICPPVTAEYAVRLGSVDVSQYEGVSFWARRGPNSQAGIRVMVGDKFTDDDLNYLAQRGRLDAGPQTLYCQRLRECDCVSHQACTTYPAGVPPFIAAGIGAQFCIAPPQGTTFANECAGAAGTLGGSGSQGGGASNCCDRFQCNQWYAPYPNDMVLPNQAPYTNSLMFPQGDIQFAGRPCTPYQWPNGVGGSFCFDPAIDPPPPANAQQCGDHWMATATLTTEWKYFVIPFTDLHQQGWAQRSEHLDLTSVSVVRFTWDAGWIDYYIDSLSFYRHKKPGQ